MIVWMLQVKLLLLLARLMTRGGEAGSVVEKASRWLLLQRRGGEEGGEM